MFYNTTNATDPQLKSHRAMAFRQEDEVYDFFRSFPLYPWSAYDVQEALPAMLITSVRRAICDLCKEGKLVKHDTVTGPYGVRVHRWRLNG